MSPPRASEPSRGPRPERRKPRTSVGPPREKRSFIRDGRGFDSWFRGRG